MPSIQEEMSHCLREYSKQKELEEIICHRPLVRPNTKKWHVILLFFMAGLLFLCVSILSFCLPDSEAGRILALVLSHIVIWEIYIRYCLIQTVKCYQHYAKEETRRRCMCVPSCSEYAILCFRKNFPLPVAFSKIRTRLYKTCKGEDYKIDFP